MKLFLQKSFKRGPIRLTKMQNHKLKNYDATSLKTEFLTVAHKDDSCYTDRLCTTVEFINSLAPIKQRDIPNYAHKTNYTRRFSGR